MLYEINKRKQQKEIPLGIKLYELTSYDKPYEFAELADHAMLCEADENELTYFDMSPAITEAVDLAMLGVVAAYIVVESDADDCTDVLTRYNIEHYLSSDDFQEFVEFALINDYRDPMLVFLLTLKASLQS